MNKGKGQQTSDDDGEAYELTVTGGEAIITSGPREVKNRKDRGAPWYYLGLIGEIGFAIAVPIAGGAMIGVVIDRTWSTTPKATLSLLFFGVVISFINLFKTVETIIKDKK